MKRQIGERLYRVVRMGIAAGVVTRGSVIVRNSPILGRWRADRTAPQLLDVLRRCGFQVEEVRASEQE